MYCPFMQRETSLQFAHFVTQGTNYVALGHLLRSSNTFGCVAFDAMPPFAGDSTFRTNKDSYFKALCVQQARDIAK